MSSASKIEWTDVTWNPVTGCTKVSAGCKNCYAEGVANRFWATKCPPVPVEPRRDPDGVLRQDGLLRPRRFTDVQCHEDRLEEPLRWRRGRRVFVNSMSDLFHEAVPDAFIDRVFAVMALSPQHTFQVLTKRPERMRRYMGQQVVGQAEGFSYGDRIARVACEVLKSVPDILGNAVARRTGLLRPQWPPPNVWLGVSVEDQRAAAERIPVLLQTPAAVRFLSCEPLLGPLEFSDVTKRSDAVRQLGKQALDGIDWVIAGGESGHGARPCSIQWIQSIVRQCQAAQVPAFVKQLGSAACTDIQPAKVLSNPDGSLAQWGAMWSRINEDGSIFRLRSRNGSDPAEWPEDLSVREFPTVGVAQ